MARDQEMTDRFLNLFLPIPVIRGNPYDCAANSRGEKIAGKKAFLVVAPDLWSPRELKMAPSLESFWQGLKTFLFWQAFSDVKGRSIE